MLRPAPASPARPAHHRPLSTTMPAKPKPMKRPASKAAAAAEPFEEAGGAVAAAPAPKKAKAVKKRAPSPTPSPDTATTTSSPPVSPSSQGERVQNGWESMRETGEPYLMWKCVLFFVMRALAPCWGPARLRPPPFARPLGCGQAGGGPGGAALGGLRQWQTDKAMAAVAGPLPPPPPPPRARAGRALKARFFFLAPPRARARALNPPLLLLTHARRRFGTPAYSGKVAAFDLVRSAGGWVGCFFPRPPPSFFAPRDPNPPPAPLFSPPPSPQDGTLLLPTTDRPADWGPTSASDWRYFNGTVPDRLAALVEDGYEVCVLR